MEYRDGAWDDGSANGDPYGECITSSPRTTERGWLRRSDESDESDESTKELGSTAAPVRTPL